MENAINKIQNDEIKEVRNDLKRKVSWFIFVWAIGIILVAIGWIFTSITALSSKNDENKAEISNVEGDVKEIKSNILWIKESLQRMENKKP